MCGSDRGCGKSESKGRGLSIDRSGGYRTFHASGYRSAVSISSTLLVPYDLKYATRTANTNAPQAYAFRYMCAESPESFESHYLNRSDADSMALRTTLLEMFSMVSDHEHLRWSTNLTRPLCFDISLKHCTESRTLKPAKTSSFWAHIPPGLPAISSWANSNPTPNARNIETSSAQELSSQTISTDELGLRICKVPR